MDGIYSAIISCIDDKGNFNKKQFELQMSIFQSYEFDGLFLCGNTGQGLKLTIQQKDELVNAAYNNKKNMRLIMNVSGNNNDETIYSMNIARKYCCEYMALMVPRNMNNFNDIYEYYREMSTIADYPLLAYHIPTFTNYNMNEDEIIKVLSIPNVKGMKYTDNNIDKLHIVVKELPKTKIFWGRDDLLIDGLRNGARGCIGGFYNVIPSYFKIIYDNYNNEKAELYQKRVNKVIFELRKKYPFMPGGQFVSLILEEYKKSLCDDEFYSYIINK